MLYSNVEHKYDICIQLLHRACIFRGHKARSMQPSALFPPRQNVSNVNSVRHVQMHLYKLGFEETAYM